MKKRIIALVLACMLLMGAGAQAVGVGAQQVNEAIGLLKETWIGVFAGMSDQTTGTLEVKNVRVVRLTGSYGEDAIAAELFGEIDCILEFLLYVDLYNGYSVCPGTKDTAVAVYKDGTMQVIPTSLFELYRGRTYSMDFSGIVDRILDFGSQYNQTFILK